MNTLFDYNTQLEPMVISEYGRSVQNMVDHLMTIEDREKRNRMARTIVQVMINLNPLVKDLDNYKNKLWDHLIILSDYKLDVDSPYPMPKREVIDQKPERVPYKDTLIKFRFYGRNLQQMCEQAADMEESVVKKAFINYIASFMVNSSRNWNDENLTPDVVAEHIKILSKNKLIINPEELDIHVEARMPRKPIVVTNAGIRTNFKNKNFKNKNRNRR